MTWRIVFTSPQLGRLERELPPGTLLSGTMTLVYDTLKFIRAAGLPAELSISLAPVADDSNRGAATKGGPDKAS